MDGSPVELASLVVAMLPPLLPPDNSVDSFAEELDEEDELGRAEGFTDELDKPETVRLLLAASTWAQSSSFELAQ